MALPETFIAPDYLPEFEQRPLLVPVFDQAVIDSLSLEATARESSFQKMLESCFNLGGKIKNLREGEKIVLRDLLGRERELDIMSVLYEPSIASSVRHNYTPVQLLVLGGSVGDDIRDMSSWNFTAPEDIVERTLRLGIDASKSHRISKSEVVKKNLVNSSSQVQTNIFPIPH